MTDDLISRQAAIDALVKRTHLDWEYLKIIHPMLDVFEQLPSVEPEEVIPHRKYGYLSGYWCECGLYLGKKGEVKYCAECGRKVNWNG